MQYCVYILANDRNSVLYTGVTNDLVRRIYEHKHHLDKRCVTARYNIEKSKYYETTTGIKSAIAREKQIKGWSRKQKHKLI